MVYFYLSLEGVSLHPHILFLCLKGVAVVENLGRKRPDLAVKAVRKEGLHTEEEIEKYLTTKCNLHPKEAKASLDASLTHPEHRLIKAEELFFLPENMLKSAASNKNQEVMGGKRKVADLTEKTIAVLKTARKVCGENNTPVKKSVFIQELEKVEIIGKKAEQVTNNYLYATGKLEKAGWGMLKLSKKGLAELKSLEGKEVMPLEKNTGMKKREPNEPALKVTKPEVAETSKEEETSDEVRTSAKALLGALKKEREKVSQEVSMAKQKLAEIEADIDAVKSRFAL